MPTKNAILYADSNRGVYIPKYFAESITRDSVTGVDAADYATLIDVDSESYWETWERVLNNAKCKDTNGVEYILHHDSDLWLVPVNEVESIEST